MKRNIFLRKQEKKVLSPPQTRYKKNQGFASPKRTNPLHKKKVRQPTVIYKPFLNSLLSRRVVSKEEKVRRDHARIRKDRLRVETEVADMMGSSAD